MYNTKETGPTLGYLEHQGTITRHRPHGRHKSTRHDTLGNYALLQSGRRRAPFCKVVVVPTSVLHRVFGVGSLGYLGCPTAPSRSTLEPKEYKNGTYFELFGAQCLALDKVWSFGGFRFRVQGREQSIPVIPWRKFQKQGLRQTHYDYDCGASGPAWVGLVPFRAQRWHRPCSGTFIS